MIKLTKKRIKELKKEISNDSVANRGYWKSIFEEMAKVDYTLILEKSQEATEIGFNYNNDQFSFECFVIDEFVKEIGYKDFKKLVPHLLGFYNAKYEFNNVYIEEA
nr:MAG TPA: hypothetical protein [Caudoviricetes sp.]